MSAPALVEVTVPEFSGLLLKNGWTPEAVAAMRYSSKRYLVQTAVTRIVQAARRAGRITPASACERCGAASGKGRSLSGHHNDYREPLQLEWLCASCHGREHSRDSVRGRALEPMRGISP